MAEDWKLFPVTAAKRLSYCFYSVIAGRNWYKLVAWVQSVKKNVQIWKPDVVSQCFCGSCRTGTGLESWNAHEINIKSTHYRLWALVCQSPVGQSWLWIWLFCFFLAPFISIGILASCSSCSGLCLCIFCKFLWSRASSLSGVGEMHLFPVPDFACQLAFRWEGHVFSASSQAKCLLYC